jgi:membrane protease YdiL (CAAX protease family)
MNPFFVALLLYVLTQPWLGLRRWRRFLALREQPGERVRIYRRIVARQWAATAVLALGLWWDGRAPRDLWLTAPHPLPPPSLLWGYALALVVALALPVTVPWLRRRLLRAFGNVAQLLPASPAERGWFVAVALTAGFCEELIFRGFLLLLVARYAPDWPLAAWILVGAVPFGLGHLYQGARHVLLTGLAGAVFTLLLLQFHSLWVPVALHVLVDVRAIFFGFSRRASE